MSETVKHLTIRLKPDLYKKSWQKLKLEMDTTFQDFVVGKLEELTGVNV
jgi:hypothetical protein